MFGNKDKTTPPIDLEVETKEEQFEIKYRKLLANYGKTRKPVKNFDIKSKNKNQRKYKNPEKKQNNSYTGNQKKRQMKK